jgi:coproporphyrinogen III oxidase
MTTTLDPQQQAARDWFESLQARICAEFEAIEREAGSDAAFEYICWDREGDGVTPGPLESGGGGGGRRGAMKGKVFEKVGVNVSTVGGAFSPEFASQIHGASEDPGFFATGISLVAHMANPHVPAVHMNTRFLVTAKRWFGGGADLNPPIPYAEDTEHFHATFRAACAPFGPDVYERYAKWADEYFFIPHRGHARGVGGIFYDHLEVEAPDEGGEVMFERNFALTRAVGNAFLDAFPPLVRRRMDLPFTDAEIHQQRVWRGRYAEFNLVHDRGTLFGLRTGGNIDAILMSLPPLAAWD